VDLKQASDIARQEMNRRGLQSWTFDMNYSMKTSFGRCNVKIYTISLSAVLTHLNTETEVRNTIRHEIAHALREIERNNIGPSTRHLTAGQWHDQRWAEIARTLGSDGKQFYSQRTVQTGKVTPTKNAWRMTCPNCGLTGTIMRRSSKSCCAKCVQATGQYFHWIYTPNN
jgi:predicted SprT family Zn-dependent metalloprotease